MMNPKFNDENYDGIVLKLPSWFIKMNNLEPLVKHIEEELNKCELSIYHSDHVSNMHELRKSQTKQELVKDKKDRELEAQKNREEHQRKLESGEIYELHYDRVFDNCFHEDSLWMPHENDSSKRTKIFDEDDWITQKVNLKSDFIKKLKLQINTPELLDQFVKYNFVLIQSLKNDNCIVETSLDNLYINSRMGLSLSCNVLCIKQFTRHKNKKLYYTLVRVGLKDGLYYKNNRQKFEDCEKLENYHRNGMYLRKN